jgi:DNA-binding transcriptional MerR regulator
MQMIHTDVRSIGEVLATLKQEFPDVTISKIRFLESQGLIEPKRTASGYRQFTEDDVARLRYILRQQKENFLPLKVIKGRLADKPKVSQEADKPFTKRSSANGATEGQLMSRTDLIHESGLS